MHSFLLPCISAIAHSLLPLTVIELNLYYRCKLYACSLISSQNATQLISLISDEEKHFQTFILAPKLKFESIKQLKLQFHNNIDVVCMHTCSPKNNIIKPFQIKMSVEVKQAMKFSC